MKKKVLAIITSACLATAMLPASALAVDFSDTQNHWAAEAIDRWSDYGVVNGMGGNTFAPGGLYVQICLFLFHLPLYLLLHV